MSVISSAPGRVCLLGDKADLLNKPVIAAAISKFFRFKLTPSKDSTISFTFPEKGHHFKRPFDENKDDPFFKFLSQISWRLRDRIAPISCEVSGDLPVGSGLSSSAACSIGYISGLNKMFGLKMSSSDIAELAFQVERNDLGIMCGRMDQFSIAHGGVTFIETGDETKVTPLRPIDLPIVIGDSAEPRMAASVLNRTMALLEAGDPTMHATFKAIDENVLKGMDALDRSDYADFGVRMSIHQGLERSAGASTPKLDRMCVAACRAGALGAKQIGAGGGGCMIALCEPKNLKEVMEAVKREEGVVWEAEIFGKSVV